MTYAYVIDDVIQSIGALPRAARRLDTGAWVLGLREYADQATREACGYFEVVDPGQPVPLPGEVTERTVEPIDGTPTVVWTVRPKTADELAADAAKANDATIRQQAEQALDANRTFLGLASPTNAQTLAQVRALTRQSNGLIRLTLGKFDGTD